MVWVMTAFRMIFLSITKVKWRQFCCDLKPPKTFRTHCILHPMSNWLSYYFGQCSFLGGFFCYLWPQKEKRRFQTLQVAPAKANWNTKSCCWSRDKINETINARFRNLQSFSNFLSVRKQSILFVLHPMWWNLGCNMFFSETPFREKTNTP